VWRFATAVVVLKFECVQFLNCDEKLKTMGSSSVGINLIQLQDIIDVEFEKAKTSGKCNR
jgi:hypothetical protein